MVKTFRARYDLNMGTSYRENGQLVPEAHAWYRMESWLHTGHIIEAEVSEEDFRAAIAQFCPELEDEILELAGVAEGVELKGPHAIPVRVSGKGRSRKAAEPTLVQLKADPSVTVEEPADETGDVTEPDGTTALQELAAEVVPAEVVDAESTEAPAGE